MKNIIFPIGAIALIILAFSNRKTIIEPEEIPKIDLTLEPVGAVNIDETPILEKYIQNSLKDPETKSYSGAIIGGVAGIAGALGTAYILLQEEGDMIEEGDMMTTEQINMIENPVKKTNNIYTFFNENY